MRKLDRRRERRGGFTLLEVLLVLVIIGVILAMVAPQLIGQQQQALVKTTRMAIENTSKSLDLYAIANYGEYPEGSRDTAFSLLLMPPQTQDGRVTPPYIEKIPKDAWDQVMYYEFPNTRVPNATKPAIWSSGPNKKNENGSGDDVNNWDDLAR